jgi:TRAP-type C4-dicarboxylate transport system substrate-binding protein
MYRSSTALARRVGILAVGLTAVVAVLAGCSGGSATDSAGSDGIPHGASKEEYIAAFEDIEPIELSAQSATAQGDATMAFDAYIAAVAEWSGGKITFDHAYSSSRVELRDVPVALSDGRLDLGSPLLFARPAEFPISSALGTLGALSDNALVEGTASRTAWVSDLSMSSEAAGDEMERNGMKMLVPFQPGGNAQLFCPQPRPSLPTLEGASITAQNAGDAQQLEAVGAAPVTMPFSEFYEALERGVVDCVYIGPNAVVGAGIVEVAPEMMADPEVRTTASSAPVAFSLDRWESLPLVAQQLLWDKIPVMIAGNLEKSWRVAVGIDEALEANGGTVHTYDDDARDALNDAADALVEQVADDPQVPEGAQLVTDAEAAIEKWAPIVEELEFQVDVSQGEFADWYAEGKLDNDAFAERLFDEVYLSQRPE